MAGVFVVPGVFVVAGVFVVSGVRAVRTMSVVSLRRGVPGSRVPGSRVPGGRIVAAMMVVFVRHGSVGALTRCATARSLGSIKDEGKRQLPVPCLHVAI